MIIGLNILFFIPGKVGGTETYTRTLIDAMQKIDDQNQFILFCNQENQHVFSENPRFKKVVLPIVAQFRPLRLLLEQVLLPFYCWYYRIEVLHSLGYTAPLFTPGKSIAHIHDLNWYYFPEDFSFIARMAWKFLVIQAAKRSDYIITCSKFSMQSIIKILQVDPKKIDYVYGGLALSASITITQKSKLFKKYDLDSAQQYLYCAGASYPHKNLITLIKVFQKLQDKYPKLKLIITGLKGREHPHLEQYILDHQLSQKVFLLGWIDQADVFAFYKNAAVFVFPSRYEGFGFPVLEAMYFGVPVVSSNAASLSELVQDAGILVNPLDQTAYVHAISQLFNSTSKRQTLIKKGYERIKAFDWTNTAQQTLSIYKKVKQL